MELIFLYIENYRWLAAVPTHSFEVRMAVSHLKTLQKNIHLLHFRLVHYCFHSLLGTIWKESRTVWMHRWH
jgi:hypothetical protein